MEEAKAPRKRDYRQRAHCNPLSDNFLVYPLTPDHVDWRDQFPEDVLKPSDADDAQGAAVVGNNTLKLNTTDFPVRYESAVVDARFNGRIGKKVEILDVGCGYGGLLYRLSELFPHKLSLGFEIRETVTNFVGQKILSMRSAGKGRNIAVLRSNAMKFLVNYIRKSQIEKIFFCFPDPHFKRNNWRRRIVSPSLLSTYAYIMKEGGRLYTITDVKQLHEWMDASCGSHPLFKKIEIDEATRKDDPCIDAVETATQEGDKVRREGRPMFVTVFERLGDA